MTASPTRQSVILVGGLGTRLGALTRDCPKPLLEVAGRPFLEYLIRNVRRFGFDDFVLLAGYRADQVEAFARSGMEQALGCRIRVVAEPQPAGTAGALRYAADMLDQSFMVMNGDSLFDFNFLDLAVRPAPARTTVRMALRRVEDASRYGVVELDGSAVSAFAERPATAGPGLVNGGVYFLSRAILDRIGVTPCSLERDIFPALVGEKAIFAHAYEGFFLDIGIAEDFARAQTVVPQAMRRPAVFFDRDGVLNRDEAGYTHRIEDFEWMPGARQAVKLANDRGWFAFVVTNQAGIARGYYGPQQVERLHAWMNQQLRADGAHIDDFRYCPHHPDGSVEGYAVACGCRKPQPGMLLDLARAWPVEIDGSLLLGDKASDLEAARAAGVRGAHCAAGNVKQALLDAMCTGGRPAP